MQAGQAKITCDKYLTVSEISRFKHGPIQTSVLLGLVLSSAQTVQIYGFILL